MYAEVSDNAHIYENAVLVGTGMWLMYGKVLSRVKIMDDAQVFGNAKILNDADISGNAKVSGNVEIYDDIKISNNADINNNVQMKQDFSDAVSAMNVPDDTMKL